MSVLSCTKKDGKQIVALPASLNGDVAAAFARDSQTWMLASELSYVLDFQNVVDVTPAFYRVVVEFARLIRKSGKSLCSTGMKPRILKQITDDGMRAVLGPVMAEEKEPIKADARVVNIFLKSVIDVFSIQVNCPIQPGKPFVSAPDAKSDTEIVGIIALNANGFRGNVALCFSGQVFLNVYEKMLGVKHETITSEIEDAVGELMNIIYGTAKTQLNKELGAELQPALPSILTGEKLALRKQATHQNIVIPFSGEAGDFHLELAMLVAANEKRSA